MNMSVSKNFHHTTLQSEGVFYFLNSETDLWWSFELVIEVFVVIITIRRLPYCSEYPAIGFRHKSMSRSFLTLSPKCWTFLPLLLLLLLLLLLCFHLHLLVTSIYLTK